MRKQHDDPVLHLYGSPIPVVEESQFLGILFDRKLSFIPSSPVASLYVEADEPSLYSQREKLSLQYAIRLAANPSNPAHEVTFPPNYVNLYEQKPKAIKYQTTKY